MTSSKIADGSVGAAAIADGGLQTRDLGDFYGSVTISFGDFAADQCKESTIVNPQPAAPGQSNSIADDIVSASPTTSGLAGPDPRHRQPGGRTTRSGSWPAGSASRPDARSISAPTTTFYYVAFDTP